jgi:putative OPT family oligopeptide transporter
MDHVTTDEIQESTPTPTTEAEFPAVDPTVPALTFRAVSTGMLFGGLLSLCNIYLGLKIGWGMNMSIAAALLGFGFWQTATRVLKLRRFGVLENNLNQTAASSGASISSAGLVAPVPALTMITGYEFGYLELTVWVLSVALVGVVVAIGLRRQMLVTDKLAFPGGVATGETLKEIYAKGSEAKERVRMLLAGMAAGAISKVAIIVFSLKKLSFPGSLSVKPGGVLAEKGLSSMSMKNLGFALDPSIMMIAVGAIIGMRAAGSMMLGAVIAWFGVAPHVLEAGWAEPGSADAGWFGPVVKWMLWPGVAMMVTASLTSFAFSWRAVLNAFTGSNGEEGREDPGRDFDVPRHLYLAAIGAVGALSVLLQVVLFDIHVLLAVGGVALTFLLAIVAGRVSGETGVTPVGAMGKVTQLSFGVVNPGNAVSNLMAANVTGGAASQCADLLNDLKSGIMLGAAPRQQVVAQAFGVLSGAVFGSAAYLILIPDPKNMLLTEEWAAPAVAQWKAVAEVFAVGLEAMPTGAMTALVIGAVAGIALAILEKTAPKNIRKWVPSPVSIGLAFAIPAYYAFSFFFGAALMLTGERFAKSWTARFAIVLAAGIMAGESLAGVADAVVKMLSGLG